jgi:DNA-binding PadR family transcriptional regulator
MNPERHLPLRPVEFQILASLCQGKRHGYAMLQEITARGDAWAVPGLATLYRAILRLEKEALIRRVEDDASVAEDDRRRVYGLTPLGRAVVGAEAQRLALLVEQVRRARP